MTSVRPKLSADTPKVVTAWDVLTGVSVYKTKSGKWSEALDEAVVLQGEAADAALNAAKGEEHLILDPYLMQVGEDGKVAGREIVRETMRATGPSIHPQFHKDLRVPENA